MSNKKQMPLHYLNPETEEFGPIYKYLLIVDDSVEGRFHIKVVNLKDKVDTHAFMNMTLTIMTDDCQKAFEDAVAQINEHHSGLKAIFALSEIDKDR